MITHHGTPPMLVDLIVRSIKISQLIDNKTFLEKVLHMVLKYRTRDENDVYQGSYK